MLSWFEQNTGDNIRMVINKQLISAEQFYDLSQSAAYDDKLIELVDGEIIEMVKPGGKHGMVAMRLGTKILNFAGDAGYVFAAETGFITKRGSDGRDRVRWLDIAYVDKDRLLEGVPDGHITVAPNLAVEILSPSNNEEDMREKVLELLALGAEVVWVVSLVTKTVLVYTQDDVKLFREDDTLTGAPALPDFSIVVGAIFE